MYGFLALKRERWMRRLIERDIVTSHRDGNLRAGFHFYNDEGDLERLVTALEANRELLAT